MRLSYEEISDVIQQQPSSALQIFNPIRGSLEEFPIDGNRVGSRVPFKPKDEVEVDNTYAIINDDADDVDAVNVTYWVESFRRVKSTLSSQARVKSYRTRLGEVLLAVAEESSQDTGVKDFLRFLDGPFLRRLPKALMAAAPSEGITIAWRKDGNRLSVTFVGDRKAIVVWLSPGTPTVARKVDYEALEAIISNCRWIHSDRITTW